MSQPHTSPAIGCQHPECVRRQAEILALHHAEIELQVSIDVNRQPVADPDEVVPGFCSRCNADSSFEWVTAYEDGTDLPPLRRACTTCGSPPGHVGSP